MRTWTNLPVAALLAAAACGESPAGLWVLQQPDEVVEYDVATFVARRTVKVPRRLLEHPEYLSINARGQMLFLPPKDAQWTSGEMAASGGRAWFWNGRQAREWQIEGPKTPGSNAGKRTITQTALQWLLSAAGDSLFWFENGFETAVEESGLELSVRSRARMRRTDVDGGRPETLASLSSPGWCECTTGVCSESCPEWSAWAPDNIVTEFFLITRFTPGQIGSTYHESLLYRRSGSTWSVRKLAQPVERPLTASAKGEFLIAAAPDGGCCGWENDSSDQAVLIENGRVSVLYDEYERYNNRNYDVSFYVDNARLGAGNTMLAYTLASTAGTSEKIRLSLDGKENPEELARIRKAITELPAVEVIELGTRPRTVRTVHHAGLVGWLGDRRVLVAQDGRLAVYDIRGGEPKATSIRVRSAADAFLR